MSTSQQLDSLAIVGFACFFIGATIGWTWYLQVVFWAIFVVFWTIVGLSRWNRKHALTRHSPPSARDCVRDGMSGPGDAKPPVSRETALSSISVNTPVSGQKDLAPPQSRIRRVLLEVLVSLLIFEVLVVVGHLNVFVAAGSVLTGNALAVVLRHGE
jgi:hypothetical protein